MAAAAEVEALVISQKSLSTATVVLSTRKMQGVKRGTNAIIFVPSFVSDAEKELLRAECETYMLRYVEVQWDLENFNFNTKIKSKEEEVKKLLMESKAIEEDVVFISSVEELSAIIQEQQRAGVISRRIQQHQNLVLFPHILPQTVKNNILIRGAVRMRTAVIEFKIVLVDPSLKIVWADEEKCENVDGEMWTDELNAAFRAEGIKVSGDGLRGVEESDEVGGDGLGADEVGGDGLRAVDSGERSQVGLRAVVEVEDSSEEYEDEDENENSEEQEDENENTSTEGTDVRGDRLGPDEGGRDGLRAVDFGERSQVGLRAVVEVEDSSKECKDEDENENSKEYEDENENTSTEGSDVRGDGLRGVEEFVEVGGDGLWAVDSGERSHGLRAVEQAEDEEENAEDHDDRGYYSGNSYPKKKRRTLESESE